MGLILSTQTLATTVTQPSDQGPGNAPIQVALLTLPPRTQSLLEFFFNHAGRGSFVVTPEDLAEAAIFDLDTAASVHHWEQFQARTGFPGMALSVKPQEVSGAMWVRKPVTPAALLAAAANLRGMDKQAGREPAGGGAAEAVAPAAAASSAPVPASLHIEPEPPRQADEAAVPSPPATPPQVIQLPPAPDPSPESSPPTASGDAITDEALRAVLAAQAAAPAPSSAPEPDPSAPSATPAKPAGLRQFWKRWFGAAEGDSILGQPAMPESLPASPAATSAEVPLTDRDAPPAPDLRADALPSSTTPSAAASEPPPASPAAATSAAAAPQQAAAPAPMPPRKLADDLLFGNLPDASAQQWRDTAERQYDPAEHLVGMLREAFLVSSKWQVATRFEADGVSLLVDAARNEVLSTADAHRLETLARSPLSRRTKVQTATEADAKRFRQGSDLARGVSASRLDELLWCTAMLAAAGRLPRGTDPQRLTFLRQWPNLTRITRIPECERLAALWALKGSSVMDAAQHKIQQKHAVGFFNGIWALNLITDDGSLARRMQRKGARNRGLLGRLLGWLRR